MALELALIYEHIVRKANNNCGRYGTAGADADIYRHLERVWAKSVDGKYMSTPEERYFALGEVSTYIQDSLKRIINSEVYSEEKNVTLQAIYDSLRHATISDIEKAVVDAIEILK